MNIITIFFKYNLLLENQQKGIVYVNRRHDFN